MSYKEFLKWCNERACDGHWDMETATLCAIFAKIIHSVSFWERKKIWQIINADNVMENEIINPINQRILEITKENKNNVQVTD